MSIVSALLSLHQAICLEHKVGQNMKTRDHGKIQAHGYRMTQNFVLPVIGDKESVCDSLFGYLRMLPGGGGGGG